MAKQRAKFRLGIAAIITTFLVLLCYFAIPLIITQNAGQYRLLGLVANWGMGLFVVSTLIGLVAAAIVFVLKKNSVWQTTAYSGTQLVIVAIFYLYGMEANTMISRHSVAQFVAPANEPAQVQTEAEIITEFLWNKGIELVEHGDVENGIRSLTASLNIHSTEERQAYLLAVELLNPALLD